MTIKAEYATGFRGRGSLKEMVEQLRKDVNSKLDFVADARQLAVEPDPSGPGLLLVPRHVQVGEWLTSPAPILPQALQQLGERLDPTIPWSFLQRLLETRRPRCIDLINGLMQDTGKRHLVRLLGGRLRAFLSDSYRVMDHMDMALSALDVAREHGAEVIEASLTDKNMRIKLVTRSIFDAIELRRAQGGNWYPGGLGSQDFLGKVAARTEGPMPGGPGTIHPTVTISNSETGHGGQSVSLGILHAICFNLATVERVVRNIHLGAKLDPGIFSETTRRLDDQANLAKARDAIKGAFTPDTFKRIVATIKASDAVEINAPGPAVDNIVGQLNLPLTQRDAILAHFLRDYNQTAWGLAQAVARTAQDLPDPDDAEAMEDAAGQIMARPKLAMVSTT